MAKTKKVNDYDYSKMLKDFDTNQRFENHLKNIRKKWESEGKKYKENIRRMKEYREDELNKRNNILVKKLDKKNELLITSLANVQKDKMKEKERAVAIMMEKEKLAKEKVNEFLAKQEKERLIFEKQSNEKSKS